jgi:hypothetical protein
MATRAVTKESKATAKKAAPATAKKSAPATARKAAPATAAKSRSKSASKINKGDGYLCELCGLQVYVDESGDILETTGLYCCDQAMKKSGTARASKK